MKLYVFLLKIVPDDNWVSASNNFGTSTYEPSEKGLPGQRAVNCSSMCSDLGVAQVFLPWRHFLSSHTIGEKSSSFSLREWRNDHDFVTRLKNKQTKKELRRDKCILERGCSYVMIRMHHIIWFLCIWTMWCYYPLSTGIEGMADT